MQAACARESARQSWRESWYPARPGASVGAEKGYKAAEKRGIPKYFFISRLDEENSDFFKSYQSLKDAFGVTVCPIIMPHVENGKIDALWIF